MYNKWSDFGFHHFLYSFWYDKFQKLMVYNFQEIELANSYGLDASLQRQLNGLIKSIAAFTFMELVNNASYGK